MAARLGPSGRSAFPPLVGAKRTFSPQCGCRNLIDRDHLPAIGMTLPLGRACHADHRRQHRRPHRGRGLKGRALLQDEPRSTSTSAAKGGARKEQHLEAE
jgi:hypothetical protein